MTWTAVLLAPLLLIGYLSRRHLATNASSFFVFAGALVALWVFLSIGELLSRNRDRSYLPQWISVPPVATSCLVLVARINGEHTLANSVVLGIQPTELLPYFLFILVAAALPRSEGEGEGEGEGENSPGRTHSPARKLPENAARVTWTVAPPLFLLVLTSDLGSSLLLAAGTLTLLLKRRGVIAAVSALVLYGATAILGCQLPWFDKQRNAAGIVFTRDDVAQAVQHADGKIWGVGPGDPGLETARWVRHELGLVGVVEQYGFIGGVLTLALLAALILWLFYCARRAAGTLGGDLGLGLTAMFTAACILPIIAFFTGFAFGVSMPLLSADGTSFVLALAVIGFITGVGAQAGIPDLATVGRENQPASQAQPHFAIVMAGTLIAPLFLASCAGLYHVQHAATTYEVVAADGKTIGTVTLRDGHPLLPTSVPGPFAEAVATTAADRAKRGKVAVTLNQAVQQVAHKALGTYEGAIVAIDPNTGDVLAAAASDHISTTQTSFPIYGLAGLAALTGFSKDDLGKYSPPPNCTSPLMDAVVRSLCDIPARDLTRMASTFKEGICQLASLSSGKLTIGEISTEPSFFGGTGLCAASEAQSVGPLRSTVIEAAVFTAVLASWATTDKRVGCPQFIPGFAKSCYQYNAQIDHTVAGEIMEAMKGPQDDRKDLALAQFGGSKGSNEASWAVGFVPAGAQPGTHAVAVAVVLRPIAGEDLKDAARTAAEEVLRSGRTPQG